MWTSSEAVCTGKCITDPCPSWELLDTSKDLNLTLDVTVISQMLNKVRREYQREVTLSVC